MTMKVVKGIGLFIVYPLFMMVLGFYGGVKFTNFFYPGNQDSVENPSEQIATQDSQEADSEEGDTSDPEPDQADLPGGDAMDPITIQDDSYDYGIVSEDEEMEGDAASLEAGYLSETLSVDTQYVLEETDVLTHSVVETTWRLPGKYVGMDREQFLEAMEIYESFPPLSEMERGFVSLEVLSFSRERVVVRMNYRYVQPSASFYLAVYNNNVIVYLEDKETVYIETDIRLDALPVELQQNIMQMMWIEDQEKLYDFLENYSS